MNDQDQKPSLFDPTYQNKQLDSKIVASVERMSEVFKVMLWREAKTYKLSPLQIQLCLFLRFHQAEYCKVSYLAEEFHMTKATISDSVTTLVKKGILTKEQTPEDGRSFLLSLSPKGRKMVNAIGDFAQPLQGSLEEWTAEEKIDFYQQLLKVLLGFQKLGLISIKRMCFHCQYYQRKDEQHFCRLMTVSLAEHELRIDCPEHKAK